MDCCGSNNILISELLLFLLTVFLLLFIQSLSRISLQVLDILVCVVVDYISVNRQLGFFPIYFLPQTMPKLQIFR